MRDPRWLLVTAPALTIGMSIHWWLSIPCTFTVRELLLIILTSSPASPPLAPLSTSAPRVLLIFLEKQYSVLIRLYFMPLISTSSFSFSEVLSLYVVTVGLLYLLDERSLLRSLCNISFFASLIGVDCWAMCASSFGSSVSLILLFVVLSCGI